MGKEGCSKVGREGFDQQIRKRKSQGIRDLRRNEDANVCSFYDVNARACVPKVRERT
jgi:hypothetical protein